MFLSGCGKKIDCDLPSDPVAFNMSQFVNPADKEDTYLSIEFNGRTYVPYGTVEKSINGDDVGKCLGYTVQDGQKMEDSRLFLLNDDPDTNYLVEIDIYGEMSQPIFYRAADTAGKDVFTPDFIGSLDYDYWK